MKAEIPFTLDQAGWPSFLVDASGMIRKANEAAVKVLGTVMQGESSLGATVWSDENDLTSEEFIGRLDRLSGGMHPLKWRVKGGGSQLFDTYISTGSREEQRIHLLQLHLLPTTPPTATGKTSPEQPSVSQSAGPTSPGQESLDARTAQKQKLDCALQLTRTVALDFNNALTTILGHTSLVLSKLESGHPWRRSLIEVEKSAERAAEIAADLADFSRQEKDSRAQAPGNLNRVVRHAVELFQQPGTANLLWTMDLEKRLFTVTFDEAKMQQAFVKVLENAVESLGSEGRIRVRTLNHSFTDPVISPSVQLPAGHYVCVEIADNGRGIPPAVLPRVFEPFFTTKSGTSHRGLGLAWVYGIVTNHGGVVSVTSPAGQGTTVRIFLPAQEKIVRDQATKVDDLRGTETVLLVDDEEMLLNLGQTVLTAFGYKVLSASSGVRALELFNQGASKIDLVITDLVMPGMSGRELIDHLRRLAPSVPILCTSGYLRLTGDDEEENYLRKPFTSQELLRKVRQVIMRSSSS